VPRTGQIGLQELSEVVQAGTSLGVKMERLTEATRLQVGRIR
jgi:hypothetical protein